MKQCFKCHQEKELSEFYKHPRMKDGHLNKCKECNKIDVRKNYSKNIDHYTAYEKKRNILPHRIEASKKYMKTDAGRESHNKANAKYRIECPKACKAHSIFGHALSSKKIIPLNNCEDCQSTIRIEGHHDDYSKPLDVRWLCCKCHHLWHKTNTPLNRK